MSKITFLMVVHNGERFIRKSIESVLNQTERDITLYIRNNGSTDSSGSIIREYVKKDARIHLFENQKNYKTDEGYTPFDRKWWPEFDGDYVSIIDHDDMLTPEYAEEMYHSALTNKAEMVVCGCTFFDDKSGRKIIDRISPAAVVKDMKLFEPLFSEIYGNLRTQWGILYKKDFYDRYYSDVRNYPEELRLSRDTWYVLGYLKRCSSFVSIDKSFYLYRRSVKSQFNSQKLQSFRIGEADILYRKGLECIEALGIASEQNVIFLKKAYLGHMFDLVSLLSKSTSMHAEEKLEYLQEILKSERLSLYIQEIHSSFEEFFEMVCQCVEEIVMKPEGFPFTLWKYYIFRIYESYMRRNDEEVGLMYTVLLGALLDKENEFHFGYQLLQNKDYCKLSSAERHFQMLSVQQQLNCLDDNTLFMNTLHSVLDESKIEQLQMELESAIEVSDFEQASEKLAYLSNENTISQHALYYRIYLSCLIGETEFAHHISYTAEIFWPEHEEIKEICNYARDFLSEGKKKVQFTPDYLNILPEKMDDFENLTGIIQNHSVQSLLNLSFVQICRKQMILRSRTELQYDIDPDLATQYTKQMFLGCFVTMQQGGATVFDAINDMKSNIGTYKEIYGRLSDQKSKDTLRDVMLYRFFGDKKYLARCCTEQQQYYLPQLLPPRQEAVFVDCGAFDGQTVLDYVYTYGEEYKKIYAYEPMPDNYHKVRQKLKDYPRISVMNKCVSSQAGILKFTSGMPDAANRLNEGGDVSVSVGTLDQDIPEKITFIKMDVEGAEQDAIKGAAKHIKEDCPELAICVYHLITDLWKIPQMIIGLNLNQKFYLRYHLDGSIPEEMVFYASPKEKE